MAVSYIQIHIQSGILYMFINHEVATCKHSDKKLFSSINSVI